MQINKTGALVRSLLYQDFPSKYKVEAKNLDITGPGEKTVFLHWIKQLEE